MRMVNKNAVNETYISMQKHMYYLLIVITVTNFNTFYSIMKSEEAR
jgi:hypothetical protein